VIVSAAAATYVNGWTKRKTRGTIPPMAWLNKSFCLNALVVLLALVFHPLKAFSQG
jgi:hypothetical protein